MQLDTWQLSSNLRVWQIHVEAKVTYAGFLWSNNTCVWNMQRCDIPLKNDEFFNICAGVFYTNLSLPRN